MDRTIAVGRHRGRAGLLHLVGAWLDQRRAIVWLEKLDDDALRDIGLSRGDIRSAVRNGRR